MTTEPPVDRPTLVPESELQAIAQFLPEGAVVLAGLTASYDVVDRDNCVIIFYSVGHDIHRAVMCGGGTHYEIVSDTVVGTW